MKVKLQQVAHTRSGDKGNTSNILVAAYEPAFYPYLKDQLTAERFHRHYAGTVQGPVLRYEVDGLQMMNFVCHGTTLFLVNSGRVSTSGLVNCG